MMYKLETHLHTKGNSRCAKETPQKIVELYKTMNYNGIVCTNHFNKLIFNDYLNGSDDEKYAQFLTSFYELKNFASEVGIDVFFGLEIAIGNDFYGYPLKLSCVELLIYGISIADFLAYGKKLLDMDYEQLFATAERENWLIIQAHPYRERTKRVKSKYIHGIEVFNGHYKHLNCNFLSKMRYKKLNCITTVGSDFHAEGGQGSGMLFENPIKNDSDLIIALKSKNYQIIKKKRV